ncbi:MAG: aminotransferase class I/II-fold pyridoxal phosphate-dependent enzyme [Bryobacteraceae bacterium]
MRFDPFLLDEWLDRNPHPRFNLASSTGPVWTLRELAALEDGCLDRLLSTRLLYTDQRGTIELREAVAEAEGVSPNHVQIVAGSSEALWMLYFHAAEPGANVVVPWPCFSPMLSMPKSLGLETRLYHLRRENAYTVDVDEVLSLVDGRTRIVLINTPHNPTGSTIDDVDLRAIHDFCAERGVQFIVDQVYHPIYHGAAGMAAASLPYATVLGDASKAMSLSGLRIGWMIDRDASRLKDYANAHAYLNITAAALSEPLAALALRQRRIVLGKAQEAASRNLALAKVFFEERADRFGWVQPRGGMTAFPWLKQQADARPFAEALTKGGVLIAPGDCFGMPEHFRFGFTAIGDGLPNALEVFARVAAEQLSDPVEAA